MGGPACRAASRWDGMGTLRYMSIESGKWHDGKRPVTSTAGEGTGREVTGSGKPTEDIGTGAVSSAPADARLSQDQQSPGSFAGLLTGGLVLLFAGSLITYIGLGMTEITPVGTVRMSGWVTVGGIIGFIALFLSGMGLYQLLKNLEFHFQLARRQSDAKG